MSNLKRLSNEFYRIQCMNWIKNVGKGYSSVGKTLENILGKTDDYESLPDFDGIELKTKLDGSEPYVGLISIVPDRIAPEGRVPLLTALQYALSSICSICFLAFSIKFDI